jgi:hypothetical protein
MGAPHADHDDDSSFITDYLQDLEDADSMVFQAIGLLYRAFPVPLPQPVLVNCEFTFNCTSYSVQLTPSQYAAISNILTGDGTLREKAEKIRDLRECFWNQVADSADSLLTLLVPASQSSGQAAKSKAGPLINIPGMGCCTYDNGTEEQMSQSKCLSVYGGKWSQGDCKSSKP